MPTSSIASSASTWRGLALVAVVEELRVLDVRRRDLRRALARRRHADHRQAEEAVDALPDAVDGLGEGLGELGFALEEGVVDGGDGADARRAAARRRAQAHERDDVRAVGVQPEVVVRLQAALGRLAGHLRLDAAEGHAVAARDGAEAGGALHDDVADVARHADVHDREVLLRHRRVERRHRHVADHAEALAELDLVGEALELLRHGVAERELVLAERLGDARRAPLHVVLHRVLRRRLEVRDVRLRELRPHHGTRRSRPVQRAGP